MKKLPIGIQDFKKLIEEDCVYIDKTAIIYDLIMRGSYYFLARPRRFGKSLLVSTLKSIFSGDKKLFEGLAISTLPYEWKHHPVIHISFSDIPCSTVAELHQCMKIYFQQIAQTYQITLQENFLPSQMLQELVIKLSNKEKVVLLIDEYDYPILKHLHTIEVAQQMREELKNVYIVIKGLDPYLKFVFLTGVSKFSKTSIFSGLNNLYDISLDEHYNGLLGYTEQEITTAFAPYLNSIINKKNESKEQLLAKIKEWYNGYRFTYESNAFKVYNPFSLLLFLSNGKFSNYWFKTGTPTFLINLLKKRNYPMIDFESVKIDEDELSVFDIEDIDLNVLLFQTGYLTIKDYNELTHNYTLGYPNKECTDSLVRYVVRSMTDSSATTLNETVVASLHAFNTIDFETLERSLTTFFATIPYTIQISEEKYYQTIFYLLFKMIGADILVEQPTNNGRIDAVLKTKNSIFIIEFKMNLSAEKALQQIKNKKYYQAYALSEKSIYLVGISFDTTLKNISSFSHTMLQ